MNMQDLPRTRSLRRRYLPAAEACRHQKQSRESAQRSLQIFLLDCAVFLDLSDMSSYLPDLKEMVVTVPMARDVARDHSILVSRLTSYAKRRESGGFALLSQALQYGLFYPDMPYGNEEIRNPVDGDILIRAAQHDEYRSGEKLLPKEEKLIELIKSELSEGRKSVVFAECSGKMNGTLLTGFGISWKLLGSLLLLWKRRAREH